MLVFMRKSIKGGRVAASNRYFESNQCEEILNTIKKIFKNKRQSNFKYS